MNRQTFKMSVGFIAVAVLLLVASGSAWASVQTPYPPGTDQGTTLTSSADWVGMDIRNGDFLNGTYNRPAGRLRATRGLATPPQQMKQIFGI